MTTIKQDKSAKPAAVELRDDALDQAAGGAGGGFVIIESVANYSTVAGSEFSIKRPIDSGGGR